MPASKTPTHAPLRSLDQRMDALKRANDVRVRRAKLKKDRLVRSRRGDLDIPIIAGVDDHTRIAEHGNGAMRQRRAWQRRHDVADVLAEAAAATLE